MEQYEPEHLSAVQLAAMRRSLTSGRGALTRRSLLRASGMGALAIGGLGTLSACGIPPAKREGDAAAASDDHSAKEKQVNFSNWTEYMDVTDDGKHRPTLEAFTKRTGIKVKYTEDINDNVEFFGKIKPQLAALPGHRPRHHLRHRLAGRPRRPPRLGAEARRFAPAARLRQPLGPVPRPGLGPRPRLLVPVGGHSHRHRLQLQGDRRPQGRFRQPAARRPEAQGTGQLPLGDARLHRHDSA